MTATTPADRPRTAPDFFQVGHTYLRLVGDRDLYFRVLSVSTDNPNNPNSLIGDGPVAFGWKRTDRSLTTWNPAGDTSFAGWHDVTSTPVTNQLPDDVLDLLELGLYLSAACETAHRIDGAISHYPERKDLPDLRDGMHGRCQLSHEFTGETCGCSCHRLA